MALTDEDAIEILVPQTTGKYRSVIVSLFCVGIILFILFTQCEVSNIKLKMKDASLILIFFALLAYINGYEKLFILLLAAFVLIYFTPQKYFDKFFSPIINKSSNQPKSIIKEKSIPDDMTEKTYTTDNEITIDADIDVDDDVNIDEEIDEEIDENFDGIIDSEENVVEQITKKKNE